MGSTEFFLQASTAADVAALRREAADPGVLQREAQARHAKLDARKAAAHARRDEAMATPLSPAMHRTMIVLAVLCALTVVGLPITGLIAYMLHAKTKAHAARTEAQQAAAAAEAQQHLTDADRDWMRRHNGQA